MTYLVFSDHAHPELLGYFTLANKFVSITENAPSKTLQKRIAKFSQYDEELHRFLVSMPLIAQLGRNFNPHLPRSLFSLASVSVTWMNCQKVRYWYKC